MRVLVVCLLASFAVLLALPESAGAPSCGCGSKLGVGARVRGGVKVKWVNLGSLVGMPEKNYGETDYNFYLRIFRYGGNRRVFYSKVFQPFKDENESEYVNRINFIFTRVYPKLDCRCNRKYANYLEKYYTVLYAQREGECDEDWFSRVLTRTNESDDEYLAKVENLKQFFPNIGWNKIQIDVKSKLGFILLSSNNGGSSTRSVDEDSDSCDSLTEDEIKKYFSKLDNEDTDTYYNRFISRLSLRKRYLKNYVFSLTTLRRYYPGLAIWYSPQYINILRDYYINLYTKLSTESDEQYFQRIVTKEDYETEEQCAKRIEIVRELLPNLSLWYNAKYFDLVSKAYRLLYRKLSTEDEITYFSRLITRTPDETDLVYVNRLGLVKQTCISLPLWYSKQYLDLTKTFYITRYTKVSSESDESLFQRITSKEPGETDEQCYQRVGLVHYLLPNLALWYNTKYYSLTQKFYQVLYRKLDSEDDLTYFKRITGRLTDESDSVYINRICLVKRTFAHLPLWYGNQYLNLIRNYYVTLYTKSSTESDESLFKRIVSKEDEETEEECVQRASLVRQLFPNLALWYDSKYYDLTKKFYLDCYQKSSTEDDTSYFIRLTTHLAEESNSVYIKRISLLKRTFINLPLWYNKQYLPIVKNYYIALYTRSSSESQESLFTRIVTREEGETDNECLERVSLVRKLFPNLSLWYDIKYYSLTKKFYQTLYQKLTTEDDTTYFLRIIERLPDESNAVYIKRICLIKKTFINLPLWYSGKYFDLIKSYYITLYTKTSTEGEESYFKRIVTKEDDETDEQCVQRVSLIQRLYPNLALWSDVKYYDLIKRFYQNLYQKSSSEDDTVYFTRLTTKLSEESDIVYTNRISLIKKTYCGLSLWYKKDYVDIIKQYYIAKYTRGSSETEEAQYTRIVTKEAEESDERCAQRVKIVQSLFPNLSLWSSEKYYGLIRNFYVIWYKKLSSEEDTAYFNRLTAKFTDETDEVYVNRLACIKRSFSGLNLWYSREFLDVTKSYYIARYTKASTETEKSFYQRILISESGENEDRWAKRIEIVHQLYPNLALWYDVKNYKLVKPFYQIVFKKLTSEDDTNYFSRITTRCAQETDTVYLARLNLIETTFSSLPLWSSVEYLSIIKPYYSLKYAQQAGEADEAYFARLVARESCDISDEVYVRRLYLVQLLTSSSALWYDAQFYEKYTKNFYSLYYAKLESESCDGWLTRAITLLPGETNENAIKRIALIKRSSGNCGCWTLDALNSVSASKAFSAEYISAIRSTFFAVSYSKTASSSLSSTKSADAEESEDVVVVQQCGC